MSISNKMIERVLIAVITGSPAFQLSFEYTACGNANRKHVKVILLAVKTFMPFNNAFLCISGDIFGLIGKFVKISIFNILTGQKRDMTELKLVWPVNMTGRPSKFILSRGLVAWTGLHPPSNSVWWCLMASRMTGSVVVTDIQLSTCIWSFTQPALRFRTK